MNYRLAASVAAFCIALPLGAAEKDNATLPLPNHVWLEDFTHPAAKPDKYGALLPQNWRTDGLKMRVPATVCSIKCGEDGKNVLQVTCEKSTGGIIYDPEKLAKIDLNKTPILRWRWRVTQYPADADGRVKEKDDQPLAIYLGMSAGIGKRSIAYRWEGATPVDFEGTAKYGAGLVQVHYIVLRNQQTPAGEWHTESRNIAQDFQRIYGEIPQEFTVSVMANSQYTKSNSAAEVAFLEFLPEK